MIDAVLQTKNVPLKNYRTEPGNQPHPRRGIRIFIRPEQNMDLSIYSNYIIYFGGVTNHPKAELPASVPGNTPPLSAHFSPSDSDCPSLATYAS
jgi:hypothetical protein